MKFKTIVKEGRKHFNLTLRQMAKKLGVSGQYLCKVEKGKTVPSIRTIKKIAKIIDIDEDYLCLYAGKIPDWITKILVKHPEKCLDYLIDMDDKYKIRLYSKILKQDKDNINDNHRDEK